MNIRFLRGALVVMPLLVQPVYAQPAAELLQRGIYLQDTAGDLDAAIGIYRQILASTPADRATAAQAQYKLAESLLRKGDFAAAAQEFGALSRNYGDFPKLVNSMAVRVRSVAEYGPAQELLGSVRNGRYHHNWTGVEVNVPAEWTVRSQSVRPDGGDRVDFVDATQANVAFLWVMADPTPPERTSERLRERLESKLRQRTEAQGYGNYKLRQDSIQQATIGGKQALTGVGEYVNGLGENMVEWFAFVNTEKTRFFFSAHGKASDLQMVQQRANQAVATAFIP